VSLQNPFRRWREAATRKRNRRRSERLQQQVAEQGNRWPSSNLKVLERLLPPVLAQELELVLPHVSLFLPQSAGPRCTIDVPLTRPAADSRRLVSAAGMEGAFVLDAEVAALPSLEAEPVVVKRVHNRMDAATEHDILQFAVSRRVDGTIVAIKSTQHIMEHFYSRPDLKYDTVNRRVKEWNDMLKARDPRLAELLNSSRPKVLTASATDKDRPDLHSMTGRPPTYDPSKFPQLRALCERIKKQPGFGIFHVQLLARTVFGGEPSREWCRVFMRDAMGLRYKACTTSHQDPEARAIQDAFWVGQLQLLAMDLHVDHVLPRFVLCQDEVGMQLCPNSTKVWVDKDDRHPEGVKDKRQVTLTLTFNMEGDCITPQLITAGKTDASLPSKAVREQAAIKAAGILFCHTENHWSNATMKEFLLKQGLHQWFDKQLDALNIKGPARRSFVLVLILDCWKVNVSPRMKQFIREQMPFLRLRFIPAGDTGRKQVGDTHVHAGFKAYDRKLFAAQYGERIDALNAKLTSGAMSAEEYQRDVRALNGMPWLRDRLAERLPQCIAHVTKPRTQAELDALGFPAAADAGAGAGAAGAPLAESMVQRGMRAHLRAIIDAAYEDAKIATVVDAAARKAELAARTERDLPAVAALEGAQGIHAPYDPATLKLPSDADSADAIATSASAAIHASSDAAALLAGSDGAETKAAALQAARAAQAAAILTYKERLAAITKMSLAAITSKLHQAASAAAAAGVSPESLAPALLEPAPAEAEAAELGSSSGGGSKAGGKGAGKRKAAPVARMPARAGNGGKRRRRLSEEEEEEEWVSDDEDEEEEQEDDSEEDDEAAAVMLSSMTASSSSSAAAGPVKAAPAKASVVDVAFYKDEQPIRWAISTYVDRASIHGAGHRQAQLQLQKLLTLITRARDAAESEGDDDGMHQFEAWHAFSLPTRAFSSRSARAL